MNRHRRNSLNQRKNHENPCFFPVLEVSWVKKVIVLGAGLVGNAIARDLAKDSDVKVTVADIDKNRITWLRETFGIEGMVQDLSDLESTSNLVAEFDLVIDAVPGFMGFDVLKSVIEAKKDVVDISFFPEDAFVLDTMAKENDVLAIVDCGIAPGLSNMVLGHASTIFDNIESFTCYVGGLPKKRTWPFEYKAPFSPVDVIEEYMRPARMKENGHVIVKPALSEREFIDFDRVGTLEAFNTDGLRTLLHTMPEVPTMREKTLRYPGHAEKILMLKHSGFFDEKPLRINDVSMKPLEFTSKILLNQWKLDEGEKDFTIMRIDVIGLKDGEKNHYRFELFDEYDESTNLLSMSRTTGFTCTMVARLVLKNKISRKGICPPELIAKNSSNHEFVLDGLKKRGINIKEVWNP